jgi:5-methylcytosine-specific restriction endonuclease McrA
LSRRKVKYCSDACQPDGYKPKPVATKACTVCGKEFETAGDFTKLRCSRRCKRKHDSASPAAKANNAMRRARQRDAVAERVVPNVVYERDNWTCQICFEPIDRNVSPRHRLAASLDHVHPLSLGGAHTYANIRLAHIGCNAKKGNRLEVAQISA